MISLRKASERGHFDFGWLKTYHTFSFGEYYDPEFMNFRSLRVINEDTVAASGGFPTHPHRDMEIITVVLSGELEHKDSMGNTSVIRAGEFQKMSAGTGILHSEFNPSDINPTHLYQIWIMPERKGITPMYQQVDLPYEIRNEGLTLIASPEGEVGPITIYQNARLYSGILSSGKSIVHVIPENRHIWIQQIKGKILVNETEMVNGDGLAVSEESRLTINALKNSEFLLFDMD